MATFMRRLDNVLIRSDNVTRLRKRANALGNRHKRFDLLFHLPYPNWLQSRESCYKRIVGETGTVGKGGLVSGEEEQNH